MKISATSALVLNWTDQKLWQSHEAEVYDEKLDISEGAQLLQLFSEDESHMHRQAVSGRKFYMKKKASAFLEQNLKEHRTGQVIILAAGLAPLSIELGALFPSCRIFDVDKYLMNDKNKLVNGHPDNIEFIECDITNVDELTKDLLNHGFNRDIPSIAVMEGIIYYLPERDLKSIFHFLRQNDIALIFDFCLKPESVDEKTRFYLTEVFRKIKKEVKLDLISFYTEEEIIRVLKEAGYNDVVITNMQEIQKERTGDINPFTEKSSCWVMTVHAE